MGKPSGASIKDWRGMRRCHCCPLLPLRFLNLFFVFPFPFMRSCAFLSHLCVLEMELTTNSMNSCLNTLILTYEF